MNTLTTSRNLPNQTYSAFPPARGGHQQALAVEVSRGGNVDKLAHAHNSDANFPALPSAKRQKTRHVSSPDTISSDDPIDELPPESVHFGPSQNANKATSSHSQGSDRRRQSKTVSNANEYNRVEDMMASNPRNARRHNGRGGQKGSSPLLESLSRTSSFEMALEDEQKSVLPARTPYKGTLRNLQDASRANGVNGGHTRNPPNTSPHSDVKPTLPPRPKESTQDVSIKLSNGLQDEGLRTKFRSSDGKRRGIDDLGSDELAGPATNGKHADVAPLSPGKRHQHVGSKSTTTTKAALSPKDSLETERSNIKPTVFQTIEPKNGKAKRSADFEEAYLEEKPSWSMPLAALVLPGKKDAMYREPGMVLVFEEETGDYYVKMGGRPLCNGPWRLQIRPRIVQKILLEKSGPKVRLESSKIGVADNVLDLEFKSEKAAVDLVKRVQNDSSNVLVKDIDSEKMQKMFDLRRLQARTAPAHTEGFENMPEDVQLMAKNQQRKEERQLGHLETSNTKRQRTRLSDSMDDTSSRERTAASSARNGILIAQPNGLPDPPPTSSRNGKMAKSDFFGNLPHNDYLRRSTRTSGVPTRYPEDSLDLSEEPVVEKYSKKYGLGNVWSKPVSYPKVGKKKATVDFDDLPRLDEGEFLNDNLVSFYMRYLEEELQKKDPNLAKRFYFFNSFFYDRLTTSQKGQKGINYEGVQRWTKGVDLFGLDYVVVPVNELTHWYVAIICNLPALDRSVALSDEPELSDAANGPSRTTADAQLSKELNDAVEEDETSEPEQKETRESFAEMSLDAKQHERQPSDDSLIGGEKSGTKEEDDEMLDAGAATSEVARPESAQEAKAPKNNEEADDPIEDVDEAPKSSAPSKKQKRKSSAPVTRIDPNKPIIMTFDSFGHPHPHTIKILKMYLHEEGKAKRGGMEFDVASIKGVTAKSIPQQSNFSDCGLFMLGYIEKFLQEDPHEFIAKIIRREYDDRKDWPKMNPSIMRKDLREQLQKLHEDEMDERRASAIKAGKYLPGSRENKDAAPRSKEISKKKGEVRLMEVHQPNSGGSPKTRKAAIATAKTVNEPAPPKLDGTYQAPKLLEEDRSKLGPELEGPTNAAGTINDAALDAPADASLVMLDSSTQPRDSDPQTDIPSSQPPQPATPGHNMPGSFPSLDLPDEIEDSQPQIRSSPKAKPKVKEPEDLALSPEPSEKEKGKGKEAPSQIFSNWAPLDAGEPHREPPPPISGRRARRQKKGTAHPVVKHGTAQPTAKKMIASEVIDIDDD